MKIKIFQFYQHIFKVRIHVERAIQRIKTFHILDGEEKLPMKNISEQIFTICAYLVNLQSPVEATALSGYFKKFEETHRAVEVFRPAWNQRRLF
jgi:hypothetical protein